MNVTRFLPAAATLLAALTAPALAQSIVSEPLGFNKIPCPASSDTIVGVPFRPNGSQQGALAAAPDTTTIPGSAILSVAGSPGFTVDDFADSHYVKFTSGAMDGRHYPVTANTADTLTVDLNGDDLSAAAADDGILVAEYWTLDLLFPPAQATPDPLTTGHAIVASINTLASGRRTEVLLPDQVSIGANLAPNQIFYIYSGAWRKVSKPSTENHGPTPLLPDTYFIVRHTVNVTAGTTYKCAGEVELGVLAIPLSTQTTVTQDNFVAIPRPIDVTLTDLELVAPAFVASTSHLGSGRKDQLLVFNNELQARNKAASASYYYYAGDWYKVGTQGVTFNDAVIPAGAGFMVRKAKTADGATVFWNNPASYANEP